jgi:hypothetical protein
MWWHNLRSPRLLPHLWKKEIKVARLIGVAALASAVAASGCQDRSASGGELHARQVVLRREVDGLRQVVARLERQEPMMPQGDASIAITDSLVREIIAAQLPLDANVGRFRVRLQDVDVVFRGNTVVRLHGTLRPRWLPLLEARLDLIGALENLALDPSGSTLSARIAIDHLGIEKAAGLGSLLSGSIRNELGGSIGNKIKDRLPQVQIPIRVQQTIDLPAVARGPVRIEGASLPLKVTVSQVTAVRGLLWVALHFEPGVMTKTAEAPDAAEATAAETGFSLEPKGEATAGRAPAKAPGKGK